MAIFLCLFCSFMNGQTPDFEFLSNEWTEGQIDSSGNAVKGEIRRGGWSHLDLNPDKTLVFSSAFTCGFGSERFGSWTLNQENRTLTFHFTKLKGYLNNPKDEQIDQIETYFIEKLTANELILRPTSTDEEKVIAFVKSKN